MSRTPVLSVLLPCLLLLAGCAGSGFVPDAPMASPLAYADPEGEGWRLVKDPSSSSERLVLALVGPPGVRGRGVSLTLLVDESMATFTPFPDGSLVSSTGLLVTTSLGKPDEARALQLRPAAHLGNKLTVGLFQKDLAEPAKNCGQPLLRIALAGRPGTSGTPISLLVRKAFLVPEDLAAAGHRPQPITVALGRLSLK